MNRIFVLALKDLKLITRDKLGMFFMLAFPVIMGLFFGVIMNRSGDSGSSALSVVVADEDQSEISAAFIQSLQDNESVNVTEMERDAALNNVRKGNHVGVIVLPPGFGETAGVFWEESPAIQLGLDPSRKAEAGMLQGLVMKSMGQLVMTRFQDPATMKPMLEDARQQISQDSNINPAMRAVLSALMDSATDMFDSLEAVQEAESSDEGQGSGGAPAFSLANIEQIDVSRKVEPGTRAATLQKVRSGWDISFPQAMVWSILSCVAGFATLIVREQTLGTQTRLLVAPLTRMQLLAGKGLACFLCLVLVLTTITLIATAFGLNPQRWDMLAITFACIGICFVGLMLPLSLLGRTEQAVSGTAWGVCTVLAMFGGGMIPVVFMPEFVQTMSNYDPVKWAVYGMEGAIWRNLTYSEMMLPWGILVAVGVVSTVLGIWMINRRAA